MLPLRDRLSKAFSAIVGKEERATPLPLEGMFRDYGMPAQFKPAESLAAYDDNVWLPRNAASLIVASTFDLDSYGTRIDPAGWDLETVKSNPVIPLQHDDRGYTGSNGLPVSNAIPETVRVENGKLLMRLRLTASGVFDLADRGPQIGAIFGTPIETP